MGFKYQSNVNQVKKAFQQAEERALEGIGVFVVGETVNRAPVLTGNLRSSYDHKVDLSEKSVTIGSPVEYAPYVEKGTRKMKAQPHLTPSVEDNVSRIRQLAAELMKL